MRATAFVLIALAAAGCIPRRGGEPLPAPPPRAAPSQGEHPLHAALRFDLPPPAQPGAVRQELWATYYYVPRVRHDPNGFALRDMHDHGLGPRLSRRDWCEAAMQGTVLIDAPGMAGRLVNYAGTRANLEVDCKPVYPKHPAIGRSRFTLASGPFGTAATGNLVPLRTIAVDPKVIPLRRVVYIPAARGTRVWMPDGRPAVHDGYFYAGDVGGAIKGTHIDVFVGAGKHNPFAFVKSSAAKTFEAYVLPPESVAHSRLAAAHHR